MSESNYSSDLVVLASQSVRRLELLQQIGIDPVCLPVSADETVLKSESAHELVKRLAEVKARACSRTEDYFALQANNARCLIMGADTVIDLDGHILGKPENKEHAIAMLLRLSNREHVVRSGVCVINGDDQTSLSVVVSTCVCFGKLSQTVAERYWNTGEPIGKAGGYAIQGRGAQFVEHLSGSYSNVVGLPLYETVALLDRAGFSPALS